MYICNIRHPRIKYMNHNEEFIKHYKLNQLFLFKSQNEPNKRNTYLNNSVPSTVYEYPTQNRDT